MIIDFDTSGVAEYHKRQFADALNDSDYERALNELLRYSEETNFPDFHLAAGMLYLQMTGYSDDTELLYLAYREFMLHLAHNPCCLRAYRNLIITDYLRTSRTPDYADWLKKNGVDYKQMIRELVENSVLTGELFDFDNIFKPGEYGAIDPDYDPETAEFIDLKNWEDYPYARLVAMSDAELKIVNENNAPPADQTEKLIEDTLNGVATQPAVMREASKIITFDAGKCTPGEDRAVSPGKSKIMPIDRDDFDLIFNFGAPDGEGDGEFYGKDFADDELELFRHEKAVKRRGVRDDFADGADILDMDGVEGSDDIKKNIEIIKSLAGSDGLSESLQLRIAESYCDAHMYDEALCALDGISRYSDKYYYVLIVRAFIQLERGLYDLAERTIEEARMRNPQNAAHAILLCRLYEEQGRTELIKDVLLAVDNTTYVNGDHVYKAFTYALRYCDEDCALDLIRQYIDEYNIMDMRLVYAQIMYNRGERELAREELSRLACIFYDDINVRYYAMAAAMDAESLPVDEEAPQEVLSVVVHEFLRLMEHDELLTCADVDTDLYRQFFEFFVSLEFRNEKKLLIKMFDVLHKIAKNPLLCEKARDELVSPYVEPIVKAVFLSEMLMRDSSARFLAEVMYEPVSSECVRRLSPDFPPEYHAAYAYVIMMCYGKTDEFFDIAERLYAAVESGGLLFDGREITYYLVRKTLIECGMEDEARIAYAIGLKSKAAADRAYARIEKFIK